MNTELVDKPSKKGSGKDVPTMDMSKAHKVESAAEELEGFNLSLMPKQTEFMSTITTTIHEGQIDTTYNPAFETPVERSGPTAHALSHNVILGGGKTVGISGATGDGSSAGSVGNPDLASTGRESELVVGPPGVLGAQLAGQSAEEKVGVVPMAHESMIGHPPEIFDGQRKNASKFMTEFRLWEIINSQNGSIVNPLQRVALALSYMEGAMIEDWVSQQLDEMLIKVQGNQEVNPPIPSMHLDTDERLWTDFVSDFKRAFTDMASADQTYAELTKLVMNGDEVDEHIIKFEHLMKKAGWERSSQGSLELFKQGLRVDFHWEILQKDSIPRTLDEWQEAARGEVRRRISIVASLGPRGCEFLSIQMNRRREPLGNPHTRRPRRGPDAIDTGVLTVGDGGRTGWRERGLSENERKKRRIEGRCFFCNRQGHFCKDCPLRKEDGGSRRSQRRTEEDELNRGKPTKQGLGSEDSPTSPVYDPESLISHMETMSVNGQYEL